MKQMESNWAKIVINDQEQMEALVMKQDAYGMNWVEGQQPWGKVIAPQGIEVSVQRAFTPQNRLRETYILKNTTAFPIAFTQESVGIYLPFNDNYEDAKVCLSQRCHTHIFCGQQAAYVMALQMGGNQPNLGLQLCKGSLTAYSVQRDLQQESNDRGDFVVHPWLNILEPNQETVIEWELFPFGSRADFFEKLLEKEDFPVIQVRQCTWFVGEMASFTVTMKSNRPDQSVTVARNGMPLPVKKTYQDGYIILHGEYIVEKPSQDEIQIEIGQKKTHVLFSCRSSLQELVERRCRFIAEKQQYHHTGSMLDGAYLIYDNQENKLYYSHLDDHNGGRERVCMGILMAKWLQTNPDDALQRSLDQYVAYIYRELYDRESGTVYNDVNHNLEWHCLYNYPWMAVFQLELYNLTHEMDYLMDAYRTMRCYYREGGTEFYGIAIPAVELYTALKQAKQEEPAEQFLQDFCRHCRCILSNGLNYPPFEVRYEQSIVAPAVDCLFQAYQLTKDEAFSREAKRQMEVLQLFNGNQPDYRQFETAVRHWDGKWFGKRKTYGDTYPHYWSALTGIDYVHCAKLEENGPSARQASASFRGVLALIGEDGTGSCALVYPYRINGAEGQYLDPWANDQDWALYFALKYKEYIEKM